MNHFRPTGFIHRWRSIDHATLSLSDHLDKQTSWLINVALDWCQVITTAVRQPIQHYGRTRCLIPFLRRVFCTINNESSQLIHRNDLKIKCKHKSFALHGILAPPTGFITLWTSKHQILILKWRFWDSYHQMTILRWLSPNYNFETVILKWQFWDSHPLIVQMLGQLQPFFSGL